MISELRHEQHAAAADASLPKNAAPPSECLCDIALGKADFSTIKICDNVLITSLTYKFRVQRWISTLQNIQGSSRHLSPRIWLLSEGFKASSEQIKERLILFLRCSCEVVRIPSVIVLAVLIIVIPLASSKYPKVITSHFRNHGQVGIVMLVLCSIYSTNGAIESTEASHSII